MTARRAGLTDRGSELLGVADRRTGCHARKRRWAFPLAIGLGIMKACLAMDVWMPPSVVRAGLQQPTLWISRDAGTMRREGWDQADIDRTLDTIRAVFERVPDSGYLVDRHLKGRPAPLLDGPAERYPEVLFEARRP